ncbi:unnamed protein product [Musa acuminata var. zebrina]
MKWPSLGTRKGCHHLLQSFFDLEVTWSRTSFLSKHTALADLEVSLMDAKAA